MCCWLWTLCHTIQHTAVLIILPLNHQTGKVQETRNIRLVCDWNRTRPSDAQVLTTITNHATASASICKAIHFLSPVLFIPSLYYALFNLENFYLVVIFIIGYLITWWLRPLLAVEKWRLVRHVTQLIVGRLFKFIFILTHQTKFTWLLTATSSTNHSNVAHRNLIIKFNCYQI